jgi:tRNA pseudouridine55 synthase
MARRKKGRNVHGWIVVDKPAGLTSTTVVNKLRWAFDAKKAGHAGTLDPAATGLLAVAFGEATKTIPYVTDALKCYRFSVRFGQSTNTDDAEGEVIATSTARPTDTEIQAALPQFLGTIQQVPPQFSAVKIDGQRAYKLAREGGDPKIEARDLYVERLDLVDRPNADQADFEMVCGKGGYVRAIARDLGQMLGCGGHVLSLRRLWSGPFDLSGALTLEEIEAQAKDPALDANLLPLEIALEALPELPCAAEAVQRLRNGNPGRVETSTADYGDVAWASHRGKAVAVGVYRAGELHPTRVFQP